MNHQQLPERSRLAATLRLLLLALLLAFVLPQPAAAQSGTWLEQPTTNFTLLYAPGDEQTALAYAGFVDDIYEEIAVQFNHRTTTPLTIRLYPTFESYYEVNPVARDMPGVVAHADFRRRELAVVLPQTEQQSPDAIQNNIRHELTHIVMSDLSDNQLNTGFQEGIAQYVEEPTPELERKKELLGQALAENRLLSWSDFELRDSIYGQPELAYPQTLSAVTFLIETYGLDRFRSFVVNHTGSSGYRTALQQTYGLSSTELETAWRDWLPSFIDGSYVGNTGSGFDLGHARQLVAAGRYAEAQPVLEEAIQWLSSTPQQDLLTEAEQLLANSRDGQRAEQLASDAREALVNAEYERARDLIDQARAIYAAIGDTRQEQVLAVYAARVDRGLHAHDQLARAQEQVRTLQLPAARAAADVAVNEFAVLGDTGPMNQAMEIRQSIDTIQHMAGLTLVTVGVLGVVLSLWGRWALRRPDVW